VRGGGGPAAASSSSSATLHVDFGKTAFFPLLKSKIGVGRTLNSTQVLDYVQYLDEIRPAVYDAELRFPAVSPDTGSGWPSLTPYPFEVSADGTVTVSRNDYLTTFFTGLRRRDIEIMVQLQGAPKQWPSRVKPERPHLFQPSSPNSCQPTHIEATKIGTLLLAVGPVLSSTYGSCTCFQQSLACLSNSRSR
jgi:hypothetical protein